MPDVPTVTAFEAKLAVAPLAVNCTLPLKPFVDATVMGMVAELPDWAVAVVVESVSVKSGAGVVMLMAKELCDAAKFVSPEYVARTVCVPEAKRMDVLSMVS